MDINKIIFKSVFLILVALCSCNKSPKTNSSGSFEESDFKAVFTKYRDKAVQAIENGDTTLYNEAAGFFIIKSNSKAYFYYYALMMANRYSYYRAYLDMYIILSHPNNGKTIQELDQNTQKMAKYYMLKYLEISKDSSVVSIDNIFSRSKIPSSKEFSNLN